MKRSIALFALLLPTVSPAFGQEAVSFVPFEGLANDIRTITGLAAERRANLADALQSNTQELALYSLGSIVYMSLVEEGRIDKQVGTSSSSSGSTTLVSRGSVPALIGVAVESGALYQSVSGNIVTFRLNPAGLARALANGSYLLSGPPLNPTLLEEAVGKLSGSASFDLQQGSSKGTFTGEQSQLKEASVRIEVINKRDPRHPSHAASIQQLRGDLMGLVGVVQSYFDILKKMRGYDQWRLDTADQLLKVNVNDDKALAAALKSAGDEFSRTFGANPDLLRAGRTMVEEIKSYRTIRDKVFQGIAKSSLLTVEYAYNKLTLPDAALTVVLPDGESFPTLSTARVVFSSPLGNAGEATINGSLTWFNSEPAPDIMDGRIRDFQLSGSLEFKLPEIQPIGQFVLTFAGMGAFLQQQPFGIPVQIGDVTTTDGAIGVFQTKLTIPASPGGAAQIPISFTIANRSEFNTENEIRGSIGLTFDLDKLFMH